LLSKYGSYEELLKLSSKEISEIKILWKKVTALVTSSWFKSEEYKLKTFNPWTPIDFRIWILWLFDKL
jgi:hypothetical protein